MNKSLPSNLNSAVFLQSNVEIYTISSFGISSLIFFILGSFIHFIAYFSIEPLLVGLIFIFFGYGILNLLRISGKYEVQAFTLVFSVCWFWAGIAAIYANYFGDTTQLTADAAFFYDNIVNSKFSDTNLIEVSNFSQGALAYKIWIFFYDIFAFIGFEKGRYIGITVNVTSIAMSAVFCVKIMKIIYGTDEIRMRRFTFAYAFCGIFWLFGSIHIRDAEILLAITLLTYFWIRYLDEHSIFNLLWLIIATFIAILTFKFLRSEFRLVPFAMMAAGFASIIMQKTKKTRNNQKFLSIILILIALVFFISIIWSDLSGALLQGNEGYTEASNIESSAGSLGSKYIVNQFFPIRLVIGFIYLLIFPIPFWFGFTLADAYQMFKSFHVLFMYAMIPLFALAVLRVIKNQGNRSPTILFLLFTFIGFTLSIAATSVETRHIGAFIPLMIIFSMVPDISVEKEWFAYRKLLRLFIYAIVLVHLGWGVIKFV